MFAAPHPRVFFQDRRMSLARSPMPASDRGRAHLSKTLRTYLSRSLRSLPSLLPSPRISRPFLRYVFIEIVRPSRRIRHVLNESPGVVSFTFDTDALSR